MERRVLLGKIVSTTKSGYVVVRVSDPNLRIRIGSRVADSTGSNVGIIADLIGNVEKPYAVVKWSSSNPPSGDEQLFLIIARRRQGARRRGVRKHGSGRKRTREGRVPSRRDRGNPRRPQGVPSRRKSSK